MNKYQLTNKAVEDLDSIWEYTAVGWSEKMADEYYKSLTDTFQSIAEHPCHLDREYTEIHQGLYRRSCRKYVTRESPVVHRHVTVKRIDHDLGGLGQGNALLVLSIFDVGQSAAVGGTGGGIDGGHTSP